MLTHKEKNMMCIILDYVDIMVTLYIILSIALNDVMSSYVILCYIKYIAIEYGMFCIVLYYVIHCIWNYVKWWYSFLPTTASYIKLD